MARVVRKLVGPTYYTENKVKLKDTTKFFPANQNKEAADYATRKRSYFRVAYNEDREIVGFYVPA